MKLRTSMTASPATATGVATMAGVLEALDVDDADGDGDAAAVAAGDAGVVASGVAVLDGDPEPAVDVEPNPPIAYVRATKSASQTKYWMMPAITDSMKRNDRVSLVINFAIGAATSAAASTTSGL